MNVALPDVMAMLAEGVPLTLLIDLLDASGPDSRRICREEPADDSWLPASVRQVA